MIVKLPFRLLTVKELDDFLVLGANNYKDYLTFLLTNKAFSTTLHLVKIELNKIVMILMQHGLEIDDYLINTIFEFNNKNGVDNLIRLIINYLKKQQIIEAIDLAIHHKYYDIAELLIDKRGYSYKSYELLLELIKTKNKKLFVRIYNKYNISHNLYDIKNSLFYNILKYYRYSFFAKFIIKDGIDVELCKERALSKGKFNIYLFIKKIELELYIEKHLNSILSSLKI